MTIDFAASPAAARTATGPGAAGIAVALRDLSYRYPGQDRPALGAVTLTLPYGAFALVAGPSGSGKSTLLRSLNGLVPHFAGGRIAGEARVADLDPIALGPAAMSRAVGFVFQNPEAQAVLDTVEAEVAFALENAGTPPADMHRRVPAMLAELDLLRLRDRRLSDLSGGERQRVALATVMVGDPRVLVLDEPTSQLDPEAAADLLALLARLRARRGLTVVLAEHRLERVLPYAEQLVLLDDGRLRADGPAAQVAALLDPPPPLIALGRALGWSPPPLSLEEALPRAAALRLSSRLESEEQPVPTPAPSRSPAATGPVLEARELHAHLGDVPVLRGVSLEIEPGELVALVGRNGAGKTTLLRCLVGLVVPGAGQCLLDGADLAGLDVAARCRQIAYLPQNPDDLLFAATVRDELRLTLANHGQKGPEAMRAVEDMLGRLGLLSMADAYPRDLSVGERQRVAFAAIAVTGPRLILLDEPTRGLDAPAKSALLAACRPWLDEGAGLLLATHDVELVAAVADRVIILEEGRLAAAGRPRDILPTHARFAPDVARLFPDRGWLTVSDVLAEVSGTPVES